MKAYHRHHEQAQHQNIQRDDLNNPSWIIYLGVVTGIVGMVTGVGGFVMGLKAYRRSGEIKALDLRLELSRARNTLRQDLPRLLELHDEVVGSRNAVLAARGLRNGTALADWHQQMEVERAEIEKLIANSSTEMPDQSNMDHGQLEAELVFTHAVEIRRDRLLEKYKESISSDDAQRVRLAAAHLP